MPQLDMLLGPCMAYMQRMCVLVVPTGQVVSWRWSSPNNEWAALPAGGVTRQELYLPPPLPAVHGTAYTILLQAAYADNPGKHIQKCKNVLITLY